jgi:hypothetical protein
VAHYGGCTQWLAATVVGGSTATNSCWRAGLCAGKRVSVLFHNWHGYNFLRTCRMDTAGFSGTVFCGVCSPIFVACSPKIGQVVFSKAIDAVGSLQVASTVCFLTWFCTCP